MTRNEHVADRIEACLDGRLSAAAAAQVRAHCAACPSCSSAWAEHAAVRQALAACPAPAAPRPAWPALRATWRRSPPARQRMAWGAAAAAVAGLLIGYLFGVAGGGSPYAVAGPEELAAGTLWGDAQPTTLDGIYLVAGEETGGEEGAP